MDQYAGKLSDPVSDPRCETSARTNIRRGNAPLAERLADRIYRAQQTEAQGRQEADDLRVALALLRSQPNIAEILDAIAKVGII